MSDDTIKTESKTATTETGSAAISGRDIRVSKPEAGRTDKQSQQSIHAPEKKSTLREYFESGVVTLIMALFAMTFMFRPVRVPTGSMKNTIYIGDHFMVNKFIFGPNDGLKVPFFPARDIRRGEVVVFKFPLDPETDFVKRVIGLPGETIRFDGQTHTVYIDGKPLPEHRVKVAPEASDSNAPLTQNGEEGSPAGAPYTVFYQSDSSPTDGKYATLQTFRIPKKGDPVPANIEDNPKLKDEYDKDGDGKFDADQYFCMGDNRDNSEDSRFWGTVPKTNMVGRAMFVYWSLNPDSSAGSLLSRIYWGRFGHFIK